MKKSKWLIKDMVVAYAHLVINEDIPNTFSEILRSIENDKQKLIMEKENKSLHEN